MSERHLTNLTQINLHGFDIIKTNHPDNTAHADLSIFAGFLVYFTLPHCTKQSIYKPAEFLEY